MNRSSRTTWILSILLSSCTTLVAADYKLYHRFLPHPSVPSTTEPRFAPYGTISIDLDCLGVYPTFVNANDPDPMMDDGRGLYQLGLEVEGKMLMTSTKSCYTAAPQVYTFVLNFPDPASHPTSLELSMTNVNLTGACPRNWYEPGDRLFLPKGIATQVELHHSNKIYSPTLGPPPIVDTSGRPQAPEVEKSFLAKYWLPLLGLGLFAFTMLAPQDPQAGGGGGGGGGGR